MPRRMGPTPFDHILCSFVCVLGPFLVAESSPLLSEDENPRPEF